MAQIQRELLEADGTDDVNFAEITEIKVTNKLLGSLCHMLNIQISFEEEIFIYSI